MQDKLNNFINNAKEVLSKHSPEILTGIGIFSMITSTVLAVKVTPKAVDKIKKSNKKNTIDKIKIVWTDYLPSALFCANGVVCLISSNKINSKRNAALTTAYALSEKALLTYKDKVIETIGENKEKKIRDEINQDKVNNDPPSNNTLILTSKGNTLMMDSISGRYFRSDIDYIKKSINELNKDMLSNMNYVSLNDLYKALGLDTVKNGDNIGWNIDDGLIDVEFSTCLAPNDEPAIVIDYNRQPKIKFNMIG
jgi:hypothetical protein